MKYEEFKKLSYGKLAKITGHSRATWHLWLTRPDQSPNVNAIEAIASSLEMKGETVYRFILDRKREVLLSHSTAA